MLNDYSGSKSWSRRVERNLTSVYRRADELDLRDGLGWYERAHGSALNLAEKYARPLTATCGIIAALSPGLRWEKNIEDADVLLDGLKRGDVPLVGVYGKRNRDKAVAIANGADPRKTLGGLKVRSFYENILNPLDREHVTIDRHAKTAAFNLAQNAANAVVRNAEYQYIAWHMRVLAKRYALVPCQFQAVCWVVWRRLKGNIRQDDLPF